MVWPAIIAAGIGAIAGELQGQKQRKEQRRVEKEQKKIARTNLLASAYGLGQTDPNIMQQRQYGQAMQGALGGAQFAMMNPNLWQAASVTPEQGTEMGRAMMSVPPPAMGLQGGAAPLVDPMFSLDPYSNFMRGG